MNRTLVSMGCLLLAAIGSMLVGGLFGDTLAKRATGGFLCGVCTGFALGTLTELLR